MSYFKFLPEETFICLIPKLPLNSVINLLKVIKLDDTTFRVLYANNFPSVFEYVRHFFPLDNKISWESHYIQMFEISNMVRSFNLSRRQYFYIYSFSSKIITESLDDIIKSQSERIVSHENDLIPTLSDRVFINKYKHTCYITSYDYYLITSLIIIKNKVINTSRFLGTLIYPFFEYSRIYVDVILSEVDFPIYEINESNVAIEPHEVYENYINLYRKPKECESLRHHRVSHFYISDLKYISEHPQGELVRHDKYNNHDALWIKYLLTYFPKTVDFRCVVEQAQGQLVRYNGCDNLD